MPKAPVVALDEELDLYTGGEQDEVMKKVMLQGLNRKRVMATARKLMQSLRGKPVIFGMVIGVVIGAVDEFENIVIAHGFSKKNPKARIRWARETTAKADQVQPFDSAANIDVEGIAIPNSRKRTPEQEQRERDTYAEQLKYAVAFSAQWQERQQKLAALRKQQRALEQQLDTDEGGSEE